MTRQGKPASGIIPIKDYEELLERVEDADDVAWPAATIKFISTMETVTVIYEGECQTVRLPKDFPLSKTTVGVRHEGETIVLEP